MGLYLIVTHLPLIRMFQGSPDLLVTNLPHPDRVRSWEDHTQTAYQPFDAAAAVSHKEVQCPHCEHTTAVRKYRLTIRYCGDT